jgi:chlorobactene glucosyltransferase
MLIYQAIVTAILAIILINTLINLRVLRRPARRDLPADAPLVSVLVPARNEARSIARCVESLAQQRYPSLEVLVLDDQSEDETAALVEAIARQSPIVRLLRGRPLPLGWHGKAFACWQLAQAAKGEWLLFVDADTVLAPGAVAAMVQAAQARRADLLTLMPRIEAGGFGEALLLPSILLMFGTILPLGLVTATRWPVLSGALGPFLLFRKESYWALGGHEAVRTQIVEDIALSRLVKRHGGRVVWVDGTDLVRVRFYRSFGETWRGLSKSAFATLHYSLLALSAMAPFALAIFVAPYAFLIVGIMRRDVSAASLWLPLSQVALIWAGQLALAWRFRMSRAMALLHGVTILASVAFTFHSAYQTTFGKGVEWKGRAYRFHEREPRERTNWLAESLSVVRVLLAAALALLGWRSGNDALEVAGVIPIASWSMALVEHAVTSGHASRLAPFADISLGITSMGYLFKAGLINFWLMALALVFIAVSANWNRWRGTALTCSIALGGMLVLIAGASFPQLHAILLVWAVGVALLAYRSITNAVTGWIERLRSS